MRSRRGLRLLSLLGVLLGRLSPCSGGFRRGRGKLFRGGVLLRVGRKLLSQAKVHGAHGVES